MNKILIQEAKGLSPDEMDVEIVERKGLGHPDSICDAAMDRVSQALCRAYLETLGTILHHNCDKSLLVAGQVERRLGGGRVVEPMRLVIGDRAMSAIGEKRIDVAKIAVEAVKGWFQENLLRVDPDRHILYQVELKPGSDELTGLFQRGEGTMGANDTSAAVGYAPLSETERLVFETERHLNSREFKSRFPETGEDVKVMGVRTGRRLALTVAMPLLDAYVESEADYFRRKEAVLDALVTRLHKRIERIEELDVSLNTLDRRGGGMAGMYLSVLGTSAEDGDSGEVGRGNQVNGLIALNRPRGSEAAAGKNPISHIGKIYSILTHRIAGRIHAEVPGLREATVWLCTRIGDPIDRPQIASVEVHLGSGTALDDIDGPIRRVIESELTRMDEFCMELAQGRYPVC